MTLTTAGVVHDLPDEQYHRMTDHLSSTGARKLLPPSTPAHFRYWLDHPQPPSDAFDLGHVVHRLVLGKGADYAILDPLVHGLKKDGTLADSPTATATWKAAVSEARDAGKTPIHISDHTAAQHMCSAVFADQDARALFDSGDPEVSVLATDPLTGVKLRARFDWLDGTTAVDLKTAMIAEPREFERRAAKFAYFVQEMFYRYVAECAGRTIDRFVFVSVEKRAPYPVTLHEWDDEARAIGKRMVRQAIDTYTRCVELNEWPAYTPGINTMSLPMWMLDDEMEIA